VEAVRYEPLSPILLLRLVDRTILPEDRYQLLFGTAAAVSFTMLRRDCCAGAAATRHTTECIGCIGSYLGGIVASPRLLRNPASKLPTPHSR
jgi:hypothetical protein